ncbi:hypothetical protein [Photobacterium kagoshimensis]|uniref:hypothetical protein n=1 Tax=Photobacterium kagoshimensis TaxID=2910242 RepID=UPI003D11A021
MSKSIREELIAAGVIVVPAEKYSNGTLSKRTYTNHSVTQPPLSKNRKNKQKNEIVQANNSSKPKLKKKKRRSKVELALSLSNGLGRGNIHNKTELRTICLHVRRGVIVRDGTPCDVCGCASGILTKYSASSLGPVVLCTVCKIKAFERSFGHADAMPLKVDHAHAQRER